MAFRFSLGGRCCDDFAWEFRSLLHVGLFDFGVEWLIIFPCIVDGVEGVTGDPGRLLDDGEMKLSTICLSITWLRGVTMVFPFSILNPLRWDGVRGCTESSSLDEQSSKKSVWWTKPLVAGIVKCTINYNSFLMWEHAFIYHPWYFWINRVLFWLIGSKA